MHDLFTKVSTVAGIPMTLVSPDGARWFSRMRDLEIWKLRHEKTLARIKGQAFNLSFGKKTRRKG